MGFFGIGIEVVIKELWVLFLNSFFLWFLIFYVIFVNIMSIFRGDIMIIIMIGRVNGSFWNVLVLFNKYLVFLNF